jgi:hypothetical protein
MIGSYTNHIWPAESLFRRTRRASARPFLALLDKARKFKVLVHSFEESSTLELARLTRPVLGEQCGLSTK